MANRPIQSIKYPGLSYTYTFTQVDPTFTKPGQAADAKVVGDKIGNIEHDLYGGPTEETLQVVSDKYFNTTSVFRDEETTYYRSGYSAAVDLEGTSCFYKSVTAGDIYELLGVGSGYNSVGFYILTDANNIVVSSNKSGSRTVPTTLNIESDGFLYANFSGYNAETDYVKKVEYPNSLANKINELENVTENIADSTIGESHTETLTLTPDSYYNTTDVIRDGATAFIRNIVASLAGVYCTKRAVVTGEVYTLFGNTTGTNAIGLYVYTDLDGKVLASQKAGTSNPTVVNIHTDGFLYVNLRDYNALYDYVKRTWNTGGLVTDINALNYTLPFHNNEVVNFGDSIFGNKRPPNDVSTALAKLLYATVDNCGFGGCRMAKHTLTNFDPFCMYRLAYSVANNDWTLQDNAITSSASLPDSDNNKLPSYFTEALTLLKSIDFSTVKSITIAYGTNDYTAGIRLDNTENLYDTDYFGGALRYSLETIMTAFPQLQIFVCCPTYRFWMNEQGEFDYDSDTYVNGRGNTMADFINKEREIAKEYHVKFIDNYYELGINRFNRANWFPATDGTHHNTKGAILIAEHMANVMF